MQTPLYDWIGFFVFVIIMLALDIGVFNKKDHEIKVKEAIGWSVLWIGLAMAFNVIIYFQFGSQRAMEFLTAYVIEKSLSVDNLFVFIMIFSYFHIKKMYQHKILFWGIIGALLMRAIFIFAGIKLMENFHFIVYIFGGFLIVSGIKMLFESKEEIDLEKKTIMVLLKKILPVTKMNDDGNFFTRIDKKLFVTPLFVALIMIEFTDLIFAVDSVPAVLAISNDMFIVYTSNIFAILGLRSLYFALSSFMSSFHYLKYGLAAVLMFVGFKMIVAGFGIEIHTLLSLGIVISLLTLSVGASYIFPEQKEI
ncbi:MAG: TerC family protein [Candidatus Gracilibacteria bacterium]|nr:TerC family protein [Candidatus Gracilibacteria bacterium]